MDATQPSFRLNVSPELTALVVTENAALASFIRQQESERAILLELLEESERWATMFLRDLDAIGTHDDPSGLRSRRERLRMHLATLRAFMARGLAIGITSES